MDLFPELTMDGRKEEEFLLHLNLSKCTSSDKVQKHLTNVKKAVSSRPFTRYTQFKSCKRVATDSIKDKHSCESLDCKPVRRTKKLTWREKIAKLKTQSSASDKHVVPSKASRIAKPKSNDDGDVTANHHENGVRDTESLGKGSKEICDETNEVESETFTCRTCNFSCFLKESYSSHLESSSHIIKTEVEKGTDESILQTEREQWKEFSLYQMPIKCSVCFVEFTEREKFVRHRRGHSKSFPYNCVRCESKFQHRSDLASHLKRHLGVRNIKCKQCDMSFDKTRGLETHLMKKHGEKDTRTRNFKCTECGEAFLSKSAVNKHMRWHTGFRPETCQFCAQSFHTKHDLIEHQRVHSGEKPFSCERCNYSARTTQLLRRHMQTHTKVKPYECKHCGFKCKNSTALKRHIRIHTGKKPFKCPYCGHRCANIENLRKHIKKVKKHQGLKVYPCSHCMSYSTDDGNEYLLHMKQYHFPYLDMKAATATKLSGIHVGDNSTEEQESETEEDVAGVSGSNIFEGPRGQLMREGLSQDALSVEGMQTSLTSSANILPELGLRSTMETLNDNHLNCFEPQVDSSQGSGHLEKGDIFLSSMAPLDSRDPCKAGAFTSLAAFEEDTNIINHFPNGSESTTNGVEGDKLDGIPKPTPDVEQTQVGIYTGGPSPGYLSVLVKWDDVQKAVVPLPAQDTAPLTLVVNGSPIFNKEKSDNANKGLETAASASNEVQDSIVSKSTGNVRTYLMSSGGLVLASLQRQQNNTVSNSIKPVLPKVTAGRTTPCDTKTTPSDSELEQDMSGPQNHSRNSFMTASSICVSKAPPKILTISPEKSTQNAVHRNNASKTDVHGPDSEKNNNF